MLTHGARGYWKLIRIALCCVLVFGIAPLLFNPAKVAAAGKISTNPTSLTMNEGTSQTVTVTLTEPIICPGQYASDCNVTLSFAASDPTLVSTSPTTLTWASNQWALPQTLTINTIDDGTYWPNEAVTLTATTVSYSAYYSDFQVSIPLTVDNINPVPVPGITNQEVNVVNNGTGTTVNVLSGAGNNPDPSSLTITSGPLHGTAVDPPGTITYTPDQGYAGTDSLVYEVCSGYDATVCASATLTFDVTDPPSLTDTGLNLYATSYIAAVLLMAAMCIHALPSSDNQEPESETLRSD